ncbi:MAG: hypothetical protein QXP94_02680 [Thermofilaceae archaeon]
MPLACKVYELKGTTLDRIIEALEEGSPGVAARRTGTGAVGSVELAEGLKVPFEIYNFRGKPFLIVFAGRRRAAKAARMLSRLANVEVLEVTLRPEKVLDAFAGSVIKLVVFDMVRVPGLRRVVLSGAAVSDSELYKEFAATSEIRYVLFQTSEGLVLGVSNSCTIVALSKISAEDISSTVKEYLLPLISPLA